MKRKILLIFILTLYEFAVIAQEVGKFRAGFETGFLVPHEGGAGVSGAFELKYNIQNKMNIGLRTEIASYYKNKNYSAYLLSILATYDYYFNSKNRIFSPFCGGGIGYYFCSASDYPYEKLSNYNNPTYTLRFGAEMGKLRLSLAYNSIRKRNEANSSNRNSDYVCLNIGFYIGGGKWRK